MKLRFYAFFCFNVSGFAKVCHSEERGISASSSAIKITNLCRVSYEDSSFLGMTIQRETLSKF